MSKPIISTEDQQKVLTALGWITDHLKVGSWRAVLSANNRLHFILRPSKQEDVTVIAIGLCEVGIEAIPSHSQKSILLDPQRVPIITHAQQIAAWKKLSLQYGGKIAQNRIRRLQHIFGAVISERPYLEKDPVSGTITAAIRLDGRAEEVSIQEALARARIASRIGLPGSNKIIISEVSLLNLTSGQASHASELINGLICGDKFAGVFPNLHHVSTSRYPRSFLRLRP